MKFAPFPALAAIGALASGFMPASAAPAPAYILTAAMPASDGGWDFSSFDPVHRRLYIARTDGVTAIDVDSGVATSHLATLGRTHAAVPINDGDEILVTDSTSGTAIIANAISGAVRATIPTGKKPDAAMVEPATGLIMVFDKSGGGVALIDPKSGRAVASIATPGALESAAADGTGKVYVNIEDLNEIVVLDARTRTVVAHFPLKGCEAPTGIALVPTARLLVSVCANHVAIIVSADDGKAVASLPVGGRPDWAGYDSRTRLVLIPTGEDGMINLVSAEARDKVHLVGALPGQVGSRSGAMDSAKGAFYLPSAEFTAVKGGRPTPVAGTFKVLAYKAAN
jgi:DNA-binding beta-propeller fold protein YncE